jgi:aryl-alcohol dehydrogenase-like predicted oxidoreductase
LWGYGSDYGERDVREVLETSVRAGINFIDTAEVYGMGQSERLLGRFLHESGRPLIVTTKFFPFPWRWAKGNLVAALRASLKRLGLERVDLYLIHWPWPPVAYTTWVKGLADAVGQGLTRLVGVSNFDLRQTRTAHALLAQRGIPLSANQVQYSLIHRRPERSGLLDACRELGVTLVAYSPLGMGLLTGKYTPDTPPPGARRGRYGIGLLRRIQPLIGLMREIGESHRQNGDARTPGQVALNWVACKGALPIPGAKNARQAAANAGALGWRLSQDEVRALDRASEQAIGGAIGE